MGRVDKLCLNLSIIALLGTLITSIVWKSLLPFSWIAPSGKEYGIVLDAGSHGTRAHLFSWDTRVINPNSKHNEASVSVPKHEFEANNVPGIGTYVYTKPSDIGPDLINPLVDKVIAELQRREVPSTVWERIPIGLKATAGMRDVAPDVRGAAFDGIRRALSSSPFMFRSFDARTISGEEEGMFGWLATNQAADTLFNDASKTIGALDMGGASAQIVFEPTHTSIIEDSYEVTLAQRDVRLYSHSYLGYGWGDALGRVTARMAVEAVLGHLESLQWPIDATKAFTKQTFSKTMVKFVRDNGSEPLHMSDRLAMKKSGKQVRDNSDGAIIIEAEHPCFPSGFDYIYQLPGLSYPNGRMFLDVDRNYMLEYMSTLGLGTPPDSIVQNMDHSTSVRFVKQEKTPNFDIQSPHKPMSDPDATRDGGPAAPFTPFDGFYGKEQTTYKIHWVGTGSYEHCHERAKSLFYQQPCFTHSCAFNGIYQPRLEGSAFKAFGQYSKIVDALGVPQNPSLGSLQEKVAEVCSTDFSTLLKNSKAEKYGVFTEAKVHKLCWKSLWSYTFLVDGLQFPADSQAITFTSPKAGEGGWAMGSMIYEVNRLPKFVFQGRFQQPYYWAFATAILATVTVLLLARSNNKKSDEIKSLYGMVNDLGYHEC